MGRLRISKEPSFDVNTPLLIFFDEDDAFTHMPDNRMPLASETIPRMASPESYVMVMFFVISGLIVSAAS